MFFSLVTEDSRSDQEIISQGFASRCMKNKSQLKQLQIEALWAYHLKKDCIVLQATGSWKSTCFHIPAMMLKRNQIGLIVFPTVALGEDHKQTLEEMGIQSVFLKASSDRKEYHVILQPTEVVSNPEQTSKPAVVIMLPEFLSGNDNHKGIIDRIDTNRGKFITLDEAHLTFEWVTFWIVVWKTSRPERYIYLPNHGLIGNYES